MNTLYKNIKRLFLIGFLLSGISNLYAQEQVFPNEDTHLQDSIFNSITNMREVWEEKQKVYFTNTMPALELRYYDITLDGGPRYYKDLLLDPFYDPVNYPVTYQDTLVLDPMYLPIIFTGKLFSGKYLNPLDEILSVKLTFPPYDLTKEMNYSVGMSEYERKLRQKIYLNTILSDFHSVKYFKDDLAEYEVVKPATMEINVFKDLFRVENNPDFSSAGTPVRLATKRKYWVVNGSHQFQISQGFVSENWYKGGVSSINIMSNQKVTFNYKKGKIQNNNEIRWDLSMYTNPNDTLRATKVGNDLLRSYSDFGIAAGANWSYSTNLELKTQLFNNYKENSTVKKAAFMSPFFLNMGILGMKYQLKKTSKTNKDKNFSVNADISPLSIKYTYVRDPEAVNPTGYGIPEGKNDTLLLGSSINSTLKISFSKGITFSSRFKCFSDYQRLELESENELNLAINRYFSTKIYAYVRFDDAKGIKKDDKLGYWQLTEILSFGLNYTW
ncbi:MAG: DUF3078 domain-containing protein [Dysgonamonadaceae bacterium]|jgi:hypothetical protein|nr:DUF3078 domain-containing protein [Dysgonamonadaceae bacterium]